MYERPPTPAVALRSLSSPRVDEKSRKAVLYSLPVFFIRRAERLIRSSVVIRVCFLAYSMAFSYATFRSRFMLCSSRLFPLIVTPWSNMIWFSTSVIVEPSIAVEWVIREYR
jgi:hypothetical protein